MIAKLGSRWHSVVCHTEVIVVKSPPQDVALTCGGRPMTADKPPSEKNPGDPDLMGGSILGKRYSDGKGFEVLVVKAGAGTLAVDGTPLLAAAARALPASD